jgi:hypothetical protein
LEIFEFDKSHPVFYQWRFVSFALIHGYDNIIRFALDNWSKRLERPSDFQDFDLTSFECAPDISVDDVVEKLLLRRAWDCLEELVFLEFEHITILDKVLLMFINIGRFSIVNYFIKKRVNFPEKLCSYLAVCRRKTELSFILSKMYIKRSDPKVKTTMNLLLEQVKDYQDSDDSKIIVEFYCK